MTFESLYIGVEAMRASQGALSVVGHNIANVNTEGYTRQRANIESNTPMDKFPGQMGTGSHVEEIQRLTDSFTRIQLELEKQKEGQYSVESDILQEIEQVLNEPTDSGLQQALSEFFNSFHTLANAPEEFGNRNLIIEQGINLSSKLHSLASQLKDVQSQADQLVELKVNEVNSITARIASLNKQISSVEVAEGQNANDLRDARELLFRDLNKIITVTSYEDENKNLFVEANGSVLVAHTKSVLISTVRDVNGYLVPADKNSGTEIIIKGGEFKGALDARDIKLQDALDSLDSLSKNIITEVNRIHSQGTSLDGFDSITGDVVIGEPALNLVNSGLENIPVNGSFYLSAFNSSTQSLEEHEITVDPYSDSMNDIITRINTAFGGGVGVPGINVSASLNSAGQLEFQTAANYKLQFVEASTGNVDDSDFLLAAGVNTFFEGDSAYTISVKDFIKDNANNISAGRSLSIGDNSNALMIADIATQYTMNNNQSTFSDYYAGMVSEVGTDSQVAIRNEENQESLVAMLEERLLSTTGVSLDEEGANLLVYQRMYQAGAKFINVMNSVLDTLINGLV